MISNLKNNDIAYKNKDAM